MVSIGLSILSWRGAAALKTSLESYATAGLFDEFSDSQLFLPDPDNAVLTLAREYNVDVKIQTQNLGIMENMAAAATAMSSEYILMLENDCPLIEPLHEVRHQIRKSVTLLQEDKAVMSRLRSVREPGQAFSGLTKYRNLQASNFKSRTLKSLRPGKLKRLTGYALYDGPDSIENHPGHFEDVGDGFYLVDSQVMPWTNQSILINRDFFLKNIIPLARSIKTKRNANNFPNLEIELNKSSHWRKSNWKIACGPGLFTHERVGDRGYE